jgi:alpha-tubulin suppressor-like RCC1 family protein
MAAVAVNGSRASGSHPGPRPSFVLLYGIRRTDPGFPGCPRPKHGIRTADDRDVKNAIRIPFGIGADEALPQRSGSFLLRVLPLLLLIVLGLPFDASGSLIPARPLHPVPPEEPAVLRQYRYAWPGVPFSTLAGGGDGDGVGTNAGFRGLAAMAIAPDGTTWVAEDEAIVSPFLVRPARIRAVSPFGVVRTVAEGRPGEELRDGLPGTSNFRRVTALAATQDGFLYLADENGLRRMDTNGTLFTIAPATGIRDGDLRFANQGDPVTPNDPAGVGSIHAMTVTHEGEPWWVEYGQIVRRIHGGRVQTVFANAGQNPDPPYRQSDGSGTNAAAYQITGICRGPNPDAVNPFGDSPFRSGVWLWDHRQLRHLSADGTLRTLFGWTLGATNITTQGTADGSFGASLVGPPTGLRDGHLADVGPQHLVLSLDNRLVLIDLASEQVHTLAGGRPRNVEVIETPSGQIFRELPTNPEDGWWWEARFVGIGQIAINRTTGGLVGIDGPRLFHSGGQGIPTDPYILENPANRTAPAGTAVTLTVVAAGTPPLRYQWYRGDLELPGQTNSVLRFTPVQLADSGGYSVRVVNSTGTVTSATAQLSVELVQPPVIVHGPADLTVAPGETARFTVNATGDLLTYRWFFGERELTDQTGATLTLENVSPARAGGYRVIVGNPGGSVNSRTAALTVQEPPVAPGILVDLHPVTVRAGQPFVLWVSTEGSGPMQYFWYRDFNRLPDATNSAYFVRSASVLDSGSYYVLVRNAAGGVNSRSVDVRVLPDLPEPVRIVRHPLPAHVLAGTAATFSVHAEGDDLSYQWFRDGVALAGQDGPELRLNDVREQDQGWYSVRVGNLYGEMRTVPRWLAVTDGLVRLWGVSDDLTLPHPLSNVVSVATAGSQSLALHGDGSVTEIAGWHGCCSELEYLTGVVAMSTSEDYAVVLLRDGRAVLGGYLSGRGDWGVRRDFPDLPPVVQVSAGPDGPYFLTAEGDLVDVHGSRRRFSRPLISIAAGPGFLVGLDASGKVFAEGSIEAPPPGLSNVVAVAAGRLHAVALREDGSVVQWGKLLDRLGNPAPAEQIARSPEGPWVAVVAGDGATLGIRRDGTSAIWGEHSAGLLNQHFPPRFARLTQAALSSRGGRGYVLGVGLPRLEVLPPTIVEEPEDQVVARGATLRLRVVAGGSGPFSYQWFHDGTPLPGSREALLEIPRSTPVHAGRYHVEVSNGIGAALSREARVDVGSSTALEILRHPRDARVLVGGGTLFSVAARGAGSLRYQWFHDDQPIVGATDAVLELPEVTRSRVGFYSVEVSDDRRTVRSFPARLLVLSGALTELGRWGGAVSDDSGRILQHAARNGRSLDLHADGRVSLSEPEPGFLEGLSDAVDDLFASEPWSHRSLLDIAQVGLEDRRLVALNRSGRLEVRNLETEEPEPVPTTEVAVAVSSGANHSLVLLEDGRVIAWGEVPEAVTAVPAEVHDIVAVAAGESHSLALRSDGTVLAWGANQFGQSRVPIRVRDVVHIVAGGSHNLALMRSGEVVAWGQNGSGQCEVPADLRDVVALAADWDSSAALRRDGSVVVWGGVATAQPAIPNGLADVGDLAAGDSGLWALGPIRADQRRPEVWINTPNQTVTSGGLASFHARASGARPMHYQWLRNGVPLPGANGETLELSPEPEAAGWYSVTVSNRLGHSTSLPRRLAVTSGHLVSFGSNSHGQLNAPAEVQPNTGLWTDIAAGARHTLGVRSSIHSGSRVFAWGDNSSGQCNVPVRLTQGRGIAAGDSHSLALHLDRRLFAWGENDANQLLPADSEFQGHPLMKVAGGRFHSVGVDTAGNLLAWGIREEEAIGSPFQGYGDDRGQGSPLGVPGPFVDVVAGEYHNLALRYDGTVELWGLTQVHQLAGGMPNSLTNIVAVAAGRFHSIALRADGTVVTWGSALLGEEEPPIVPLVQLNSSVIRPPVGLDEVVDIAAGDGFCVALRANGEVVTWGDRPPAIPDDVRLARVAAGHRHIVGLRLPSRIRPLVVEDQPRGTVAVRGADVRLQVGVAGVAPMAFQWLRGTNVLAGATNSILDLRDIRPEQAGRYRVLISNSEAEALSGAADVVVLDRGIQLNPVERPRDGRFRIRLETDRPTTRGSRSHAYVEISEDLRTWNRLEGAFNPETGEIDLVDTQASGFIRLVIP